MDNVQGQLIKKYLDLFWRRKLFIAIFFIISLPVGLAAYLIIPKTYDATSLLSYQQQQLSPNKMSPDMKGRVGDIISTLGQIVMSRNNLEELILSLDLYQEAREEKPIEDVIEMMRKKITIEPSKRGDTFQISFEGADPRKVVRVTNELAAAFIAENLQYRQERATETSTYTSDELRMAKVVMDKQEIALRDYKLKNYNEMPDQQESNVSRLISLQEQYQGKQESIQDLERTLILIQDQISTHKKVVARSYSSLGLTKTGGQEKNISESPIEKLNRLHLLLDALQDRYTERHPDVKRVKKQIAKMESEIAETGGSSKTTRAPVDQLLSQLESQKRNVQISIKNIELEKERLKETIDKHEKWVSAAPVREAEWAVLTREYGQLKKHYEYLVGRNLEAKSMVNLERRQQGSQFKIEDPARMPTKPTKPDFVKIMVMAIVAGLGAAVGVSLVLDFTDGTFRNAGQVESFLDLPVVGVISYIVTDEEKRKTRILCIVKSLVVSLMVVGIAGLFFFASVKGMIVL